MRRKMFVMVCMMVAVALSGAGTGFSGHKEETGTVKGTVTRIEATEYEITLKDDKGRETKAKVRDISDVKVGDTAVIGDGKARKAVTPISGGY